MITDARAPAAHSPTGSETPAWPRLALAPLPLFPLQPLLGRIVRKIAAQRPEIFGRIGPHTGKCFLIDPVNMPFVLMLYPDPAAPRLKAVRRHDAPAHDARIAGSFLTLLDEEAESFTFQLFHDGKPGGGRILHGTLAEHWDTLVRANRGGRGVFVTVNATDGPGAQDREHHPQPCGMA